MRIRKEDLQAMDFPRTVVTPRWGYLLGGEVTVTYDDGSQETVSGGDLFYWPPGHSVRVGRDAEVILFSPAKEHNEVIDHMKATMGA